MESAVGAEERVDCVEGEGRCFDDKKDNLGGEIVDRCHWFWL